VSLRERLNWFETKLLFGKRILVTRAADKAPTLAAQLEAYGAEVVQLPVIELVPVRQNSLLREVLSATSKPEWVFFTSPEGLGWFSKLLKAYRKDIRWLSGCRIGAIGPKTAQAIEAHGLRVDCVPKRFSQEGMLETIPKRALSGKRALILSAEGSRDALETGLRAHGMQVVKLPMYKAVMPNALMEGLLQAFDQPFDAVTVTSTSCVEHLFQALQGIGRARLFRRLRMASIGPVSSAAVRAHGGCVIAEAETSTVEGLIEILLRKMG
jgi:uroporphyrinogen III methyltransferase/synthase